MSIEVNIKHDKEFQPKVTEKYISFENSKGEKIRINLPENSNVTTISEEEINLIMDNYKIIKPDYIKMREEEILSEIEEIPEEETSNETNCINKKTEEDRLKNKNNDKKLLKQFISCFLIPIIPTVIIGSIALFILKLNIIYLTVINIFMYLMLIVLCILIVCKANKKNKFLIHGYVSYLIFLYSFSYLYMYEGEKSIFFTILTAIITTTGLVGIFIFFYLSVGNNKK